MAIPLVAAFALPALMPLAQQALAPISNLMTGMSSEINKPDDGKSDEMLAKLHDDEDDTGAVFTSEFENGSLTT